MQDVFDVFFSYHWRDHAAVEHIAQALIDRGIGVFLDRWYLAAGQPWPQALEAALARCRAVAVFLGAEGFGPWQQREKNLALDRQGREPGFPVIPVLLSRVDPPLGFLKLNTWVDLSAGAADDTALEILTAAIRGEPPGPEVGRRIESARATICPYRGLRPFREEDEPFFFGRAAFTETLTTTLARQSFVAVVGASGSGKSSVVRAGLIPRLRRGGDGRMWEAVPKSGVGARGTPQPDRLRPRFHRWPEPGLAAGFADEGRLPEDLLRPVLRLERRDPAKRMQRFYALHESLP